MVVALLLIIGAFAAVFISSAQTCVDCGSPVGFAGNTNYNFYPYESSGSGYPTTRFDTTVNIQTSFSASGYFTGLLEGCSADDSFTYQNNFFDPSGEFIQEVLAVGLTANTPSCFTIEWGPAGTTQVYNYMATMIPASYTPSFENAGNSLDFVMQGVSGELPNGEVNITSFNLILNGVQVAVLTPSQMIGYTSGQPLNGADGPIFYDTSTGQNLDIVGPGGGQSIVFTSGAGTIDYCGSVPDNPPELGGLMALLLGNGTTVESSNLFYGSPTASSGSCSYAPTPYSQWFNILPQSVNSTTTTTTTTGSCDQGTAPGLSIASPACGTTTSNPNLTITGTHSLLPGNYATGLQGQALGFPCSNGNTANPPGCPYEPQLNLLSAYASNYNPQAGTFQVNMNVSDLSNLALVAAPAQGQYWSFQWTFQGTEYFAQMDEWLTNQENVTASGVTGPMQVSGISFWYGTVSLVEINSGTPAGGLLYTAYSYLGQISGSYSQSAPGTISMTVPVSLVGNPVAGSTFPNLLATTGQVASVYTNYSSTTGSLQVISTPDTIVATDPYTLGSPLLPDGSVEVAVLPSSVTPSSSTTWSSARLVNYPDSNNWEFSTSVASSPAGSYTIYARQYDNYTNSVSPSVFTQINYSPTVSLSLSPVSGSVHKNQQISTIATISGGIQSVYLTASSLPKGVSMSFSSNPLTNSFSGVSSTITFYTSPHSAKGTFLITITAIGADGQSSSGTYVLTIQ